MNTSEKILENLDEPVIDQPVAKTIEDYVLPCKPGDEAWYIENMTGDNACVKKGIVKVIGFTTKDIQVTFEGFSFLLHKPFIWNTNVFATEVEAKQALKDFYAASEKVCSPIKDLIEKLKQSKGL